MNYMNTPFMEIFGGTKETVVKFIISQYHNGRFYFDGPIGISSEVIYKLTGLSNQGDLVAIGKIRTGRTTDWNANREELERDNDQSSTSPDTTNRGQNHSDRTHPYRSSERYEARHAGSSRHNSRHRENLSLGSICR